MTEPTKEQIEQQAKDEAARTAQSSDSTTIGDFLDGGLELIGAVAEGVGEAVGGVAGGVLEVIGEILSA